MLQLLRKNKRHIAQNVLNLGLYTPYGAYTNVVCYFKKKRTKIKPFNENNILPSITIKINKL